MYHDPHLKCLLKQIANNLEQLFENSNRIEWKPKQPDGRGEYWSVFRDRLYHDLTGFSYTRVKEINKELKDNDNRLQPAKPRGPPPRDLHNEVPGLRAWFEEQAEKANKGGYLTVEKLQATFRIEYPLHAQNYQPVGREVMRNALLNAEFQYGGRTLKRLEARASPKVLQALDEALKFVIENTDLIHSDISGKPVYRWTRDVAETDECYLDGSAYRDDSWWNENTRQKDHLSRSSRITMLHSIFSGSRDGNPVLVPCKYWNTLWSKKRKAGFHGGEYFGKCNGEIIEQYYETVFEAAQPRGCILFTDNARMHKRIRSELRGEPEDIIDWCTSSDEVSQETQEHLEVMVQSAGSTYPTRAALLSFLRDRGVATFEVEKIAKKKNCKVVFLPPYYSELNAIELLWAEIKRYYKNETDTSKPWEIRLREAVESITPQFVESCFDRCIRWARRKYSERIAPLPAEPAGPTQCQRHPLCIKPVIGGRKHVGRCKLGPAPAGAAAPAAEAVAAGADVAEPPVAVAAGADVAEPPVAVAAGADVAEPPAADADDAVSVDVADVDEEDEAGAADEEALNEFFSSEIEDNQLFEELDIADDFMDQEFL